MDDARLLALRMASIAAFWRAASSSRCSNHILHHMRGGIDDLKQIIEIVGNSARQLSDGLQLLGMPQRLLHLFVSAAGAQSDDAVGDILGQLDEQGHFLRAEGVWFARVDRQDAEHHALILQWQVQARPVPPLQGRIPPRSHYRVDGEVIVELGSAGTDRHAPGAAPMRVISPTVIYPTLKGESQITRFVAGISDGDRAKGLFVIVLDQTDPSHAVAAEFDDHTTHRLEEFVLVGGANHGLVSLAHGPENLTEPQRFPFCLSALGMVMEVGDDQGFLVGADGKDISTRHQRPPVGA